MSWLLSPEDGYESVKRIDKYYFLLSKDEGLFLMDLEGKIEKLPYEKMEKLVNEKGYFTVVKDNLMGLYHIEKGELIQPVYSKIKAISREILQVSKYGMNAGINYKNELVVPYGHFGRMEALGPKIVMTQRNKKKVFYKSDGTQLKLGNISRIQSAGFGLSRVTIQKKLALADAEGQLFTEPEFNRIQGFKEERARAQKNNLWGAFDTKGKVVIPFHYEGLTGFNHGFSVAKKDGKVGLLAKDGSETLFGQYDKINIQSENRALVVKEGKKGCIDLVGNEIIPPVYVDITNCSMELIPAKKDTAYGYITQENKVYIDFQYQKAYPFIGDNPVAIAQQNDSLGLINKKGEFVLAPQYYRITWDRATPLFHVQKTRRSTKHYFNKQAKELPLKEYGNGVQLRHYKEGLMVFQTKKMHGYIDENGKVIVPPIFKSASGFSDGLAIVQTEDGVFGVLKHPKK